MKISIISIRSKIWLCVLIGLAGYLIATITSSYTNIKQYKNLSHLQEEHYPLAALGSRLINTFELQTGEYEDAFMTGEQSLAMEAIEFKDEMLDVMDHIHDIVRKASSSPVSEKSIVAIREEYLVFAALAEKIYAHPSEGQLSRDDQKRIRELGQMQGALMKGMRNIADQLDSSLIEQIEKDKNKSLYAVFFLGLFFVTVLLFVGLIVDRVSIRLLVSPLANILDNIKRFSLGQRTIKPLVTEDSDEIGHLARAFWEMTENLKATTVSKRYVDNIIHNMSGALVVLNPDMKIEALNQQAIILFDYGEEELLGRQVEVLFPRAGEGKTSVPDISSIISAGQVKNMDTICRARNGGVFPAHFSGSSMYNDANELQGIICVFNDVTELKNTEKKLKEMAHFDPLTGLANRNLFFQCLDHAICDARRHNRSFALLYLDLDKFKPVNDIWGHNVGDKVLQEVGKRLKECVRADDTVARMGGDEFVILLSALKEPEGAERIAEKIIKTILEPFLVKNSFHNLGVSIGISVFPDHGVSVESLIAQADKAMYRAKKEGGNCYKL
ncbi:MAG: diguanylate cyclase [Desulfocapsaceae bacterium]|nr:diguanylate cyclase [Desulfocapsaceae bacterium]